MKVLAFAASNHSASINRKLVGYAAERLKAMQPDAEIEFVDINDYEMPIYSLDREQNDGVHPLAQDFFAKIGAADAILVSFAEYNSFVTSAWKNIYDWMSRVDGNVWQGKPVTILAASPGGRGGASVLESQANTAPYRGMDLRGRYGVGSWGEAWDGNALTKADDIAGVDEAVKALLG